MANEADSSGMQSTEHLQPGLSIREITTTDYPTLLHWFSHPVVATHLSPKITTPEQLSSYFESIPGRKGYVACDATGKLVGTFTFTPQVTSRINVVTLEKVAINPDLHANGYGKEMLRQAVDTAFSEDFGALTINLSVVMVEGWRKLLSLYENLYGYSQGFLPTGLQIDHIIAPSQQITGDMPLGLVDLGIHETEEFSAFRNASQTVHIGEVLHSYAPELPQRQMVRRTKTGSNEILNMTPMFYMQLQKDRWQQFSAQ